MSAYVHMRFGEHILGRPDVHGPIWRISALWVI